MEFTNLTGLSLTKISSMKWSSGIFQCVVCVLRLRYSNTWQYLYVQRAMDVTSEICACDVTTTCVCVWRRHKWVCTESRLVRRGSDVREHDWFVQLSSCHELWHRLHSRSSNSRMHRSVCLWSCKIPFIPFIHVHRAAVVGVRGVGVAEEQRVRCGEGYTH